MGVYRLDPNPLNLDHPSWQASSIKEAVWAGAESPNAARELVARLTMQLVQPATKFAPKILSPWLDSAITSCVWYPEMSHTPDGTVMTVVGNRPINSK